MAWYKTGTVSISNGSTTVTGVGTNFSTNARVGDGFNGPDGKWYEIVNIASSTVLGIFPAYAGGTVSDSLTWIIAPLQGYNKESADRLRAITDSLPTLLDNKQDKSANLTSFSSLAGVEDRLPYFIGQGSLSLSPLTAKARALLARTDTAGMQTELELIKVSSPTDTTAGRLMTVGYMGLGGQTPVLSTTGAVNSLTKTGYYYAAGTGDTPESYGFLTHIAVSANDASQEFQGITTNNQWRRVLSGGSWTLWKLILSSNELSLDPANGGIMSSTVVNGFTVSKFANGLMCIMGKLPDVSQIAANASVNTTATIPSGFISTDSMFPVVIATGNVSVDHYGVGNYYIASPTSFNFGIKNGANAQAFLVRTVIWGRWK